MEAATPFPPASEPSFPLDKVRVVKYAISPPFKGCTKQQVLDWFATRENWQKINVDCVQGKGTVGEADADGNFLISTQPEANNMHVSNLRTSVTPEVDIMLTVTSPKVGMAFDVLFSISDGPDPVVTRKICNTRGMGGCASCCGCFLAAAVIKPVMMKEYEHSIKALLEMMPAAPAAADPAVIVRS